MATFGIITMIIGTLMSQWGVVIGTGRQYSRGNLHVGVGTAISVIGAFGLSVGMVSWLLSL